MNKNNKKENPTPCYFCGHLNMYPWLVCENPNCEEVIALNKQRIKNWK